ncbi:hypothetical protein V9T40_001530 [Parthenolecanium corni]|uniref:Ran-binding protein 9 n=1 Tax=Parthenolecanium corni TaxID=536013 RepID=A0AAN9TIV0_9HEMI
MHRTRGHGKTHKDAASVRATHPIPPSCGLYYFEVKIISKGRDGYMGIGLSAQGVNMNRLPGWDKHSYGYHGDDGHSFCSSGTGQPYGPTFTTGDVIGCGVNLIDNTAFYTKNGHNLGIAFTDLPSNLYPTVGLQTPGEIVDANFGQSPFVFDIEDMMKELRARVKNTIYKYQIPDSYGQWQTVLQKMVSTYLVHHGYCSTAEAFARGTGQAFDEEITSIKNRQRILKLVLNGKMGEAIETTSKIYPGLLQHNRNLLFMLKCRQFVEMVNGTDTEVCPPKCQRSQQNVFSSPVTTPPRHSISPQPTSVIQSTKSLNNNNISSSRNNHQNDLVEEMNATNTLLNGANGVESVKNGVCENDVEMISQPATAIIEENNKSNNSNSQTSPIITKSATNGTTNGYQNGNVHDDHVEDMDIDPPASNNNSLNSSASDKKRLCGGSKPAVERMLEFGRELFLLSVQLKQDMGKNETNKKMLQDAFSLLAYSNPWNSPVGWQLDPVQRESVCATLNSAILESSNLARRPPLEVAVAHTTELITLMSHSGLGSCAFANLDDLLHH